MGSMQELLWCKIKTELVFCVLKGKGYKEENEIKKSIW